ncbi:VOC family protein [Streptomyces yangpuensis]|uniref:VOC family protein n=1 Tax=Streptomyces yangpuensis TaxID=1648182 RepID=UPI003658DF80
MTTLNATVSCSAWNCDDPKAMADFYHQLTGWQIMAVEDTHTMIGTEQQMMVFARQDGFKAPNWPADTLTFHLDFRVEDTEAAGVQLVKAGRTKPDFQPGEGQWTVLWTLPASPCASAPPTPTACGVSSCRGRAGAALCV